MCVCSQSQRPAWWPWTSRGRLVDGSSRIRRRLRAQRGRRGRPGGWGRGGGGGGGEFIKKLLFRFAEFLFKDADWCKRLRRADVWPLSVLSGPRHRCRGEKPCGAVCPTWTLEPDLPVSPHERRNRVPVQDSFSSAHAPVFYVFCSQPSTRPSRGFMAACPGRRRRGWWRSRAWWTGEWTDRSKDPAPPDLYPVPDNTVMNCYSWLLSSATSNLPELHYSSVCITCSVCICKRFGAQRWSDEGKREKRKNWKKTWPGPRWLVRAGVASPIAVYFLVLWFIGHSSLHLTLWKLILNSPTQIVAETATDPPHRMCFYTVRRRRRDTSVAPFSAFLKGTVHPKPKNQSLSPQH